jgi:hypothetical protein
MRELHIVNAAELAEAYAKARYAVILDGDALTLRVGEPAQDVEAYWPASHYGFITAWNPASLPQSDAANEAAGAALAARLDALGTARQPAYAFDQEGGWREEGWLVADLEEALLDLIAREFSQAGVLAWSFGEPVRLRMQMARPAGATAHDCVDWAGAAPPAPARPRPGLIA